MKKTRRSRKSNTMNDIPGCGLCGKTENLVKTLCCNNWICSDEDKNVPSSSQNSCSRNHNYFTLCGYHYNEGHEGKWQDCQLCKDSFETEIYVNLGTNEHNFEKLKNPPSFEPTRCSLCNNFITLSEGGYSLRGNEYFCAECTAKDFEKEMKELQNKNVPD